MPGPYGYRSGMTQTNETEKTTGCCGGGCRCQGEATTPELKGEDLMARPEEGCCGGGECQCGKDQMAEVPNISGGWAR